MLTNSSQPRTALASQLILFLCFLLVSASGNVAARHLRTAIAELRQAGIDKILIGEVHEREFNADLSAHVAVGSMQYGAKENLWIEVHSDSRKSHESVEDLHSRFHIGATSTAENHRYIGVVCSALCNGSHDRCVRVLAREPEFFRAMLQAQLRIDFLEIYWPHRGDMDAFLASPDFAIAVMGESHALGDCVKKDRFYLPWSGITGRFPSDVEGFSLRREEQVSAFSGFRRAAQQGTAALVLQIPLPERHYESLFNVTEIRNYYVGSGMVALQIPVRRGDQTLDGYQALILAPAGMLPVLQRIKAGFPGKMKAPLYFEPPGLRSTAPQEEQ